MADKGATIDGLSLPLNAGARPLGPEAPAFRLPVRRSLALHPVLAGAVALLVLCALLGFALSRKPVYRASTRVYVEPVPTHVLGDGTGNYDMGRYESFLQEQMETIDRPDILEAAIRAMPQGTWQQPGEPMPAAVARLDAALKTERVSTSYQLEISVGARTPAVAAAAANAVTGAYLQATHKDTESLAAGRLQLLTGERQRLADEMDAERQEQATLGSSLGVANPAGAGGDAFDTELQATRAQLSSAREAHDMAAAQLSALMAPGGRRSAGAVASAEESVAADPAVSSLRIGNSQRRAALMAQMNGMKPANPLFQQDQAELARLDAQLNSTSATLQAAAEQRTEARLRQELARTGDLEARLSREVSHDTAAAASAGPKLQRAAELTADLIRLQTRYAAVDDALRGLQLETSGPGMVHLAVAATVPAKPEPSKSRILMVVALPLGLMMGLLAALLATRLNGRVYTAGDVEEILGFAPVGTLPSPGEVSDGCGAEYLLRLAAGLEAAHRHADARSFVFTAASAGSEGLPVVSALEHRLRDLGFSTTLLPARDLLRHRADPVPQGSQDGFATRTLRQLAENFNLVLIAGHPLLHSAEAEYAVRSADAVILLVESGVTTQRELRQAAFLLRRLQARGVGVLLFGISLRHADAEFRKAVAVVEKRELTVSPAPARAARAVPAGVPQVSIPFPAWERDDSEAGGQPVPEPETFLLHRVSEAAEPDTAPPAPAISSSVPVPHVPIAAEPGVPEDVAPPEVQSPAAPEDGEEAVLTGADSKLEPPTAFPAETSPEDLPLSRAGGLHVVTASEGFPASPEDSAIATPAASTLEAAPDRVAGRKVFERGPLAPVSPSQPVTPISQRRSVSPEEGSGLRRVLSLPPSSFTTRAHSAFRLERMADSREHRATAPEPPPGSEETSEQPAVPAGAPPRRTSPKLWQVDDTATVEENFPASQDIGPALQEPLPAPNRLHSNSGVVRAQHGAGRQWAALSRFVPAEAPEDEVPARKEQHG